MTWKIIDSNTPRDKHILLIGYQTKVGHEHDECDVQYNGEIVFSGYWDSIDGAWCATGTGFNGPFFNVRAWQELPEVNENPFVLSGY